jgi:histidyl-tRNA synthetase
MAYSGSLQPPKGTRDFYPEDMRVQNHLFDTWRKICLRYGFEEYEGPTFESLELYTGKSGSEIVSQLYHFTDKGDRQIALRPELTPTVARMVNQKGSALKLPIKWFSMPRLFRYEKMQRGRLREFFQLNMDIIGCETLWAEVDLLCAIIEMLRAFGLSETDFRIRLSNRRLLAEILDMLNVPETGKPGVYSALDKREKLPPEAFAQLLSDAGLTSEAQVALNRIFASTGLDGLQSALSEVASSLGKAAEFKGLDELIWIRERMVAQGFGSFVELDLSVVRGLAYYTGIVFEVYDAGKSMRAIAGGGRYDNLLENLGGRPLSGVGFGMGDVVIADLLRDKNLLPSTQARRLDLFIATFGEPSDESFRIAQAVRARGLTVACSITGGKLKKQLAQADEAGARKVLFIGSDRAPEGQFEIKDLVTGEQSVVSLENLR